MDQSRLEEINTKIEKLNKKLDKLDYIKWAAWGGDFTSGVAESILGIIDDDGIFALIAVLLFPITLLGGLTYVIARGVERIVEFVCWIKIKKINKKIAKLQKEKELLDLASVKQNLQDNVNQLEKALKIDKVSDKKIEQLKDICKRLKLELTKLENVANKQSTNKTIAKEPANLTVDEDVTK